MVYGLVSTAVVELTVPSAVAQRVAARQPTPAIPMRAVSSTPVVPQEAHAAAEAPVGGSAPAVSDEGEPADDLERGYRALRPADFDAAVTAWALFLQTNPTHDLTDRIRGGLEAAARLRGMVEKRYGG